jgi:8-oxo-dGTP diphosphatase
MKHRISVGVIVEDAERLLLVRHMKPGAYDFWVAPGGGVQGTESLTDGARREAREETGLDVEPRVLAYIEELVDPETRYVKFWFVGSARAGVPRVDHPEAAGEHIIEAAWLSKRELEQRIVFPPVLVDRYWHDRAAGFGVPVVLPLRRMEFW